MRRTLRPVGFFSGLAFGDTWATSGIRDAVGLCRIGEADRASLLRYLDSGLPFLEVMCHVEDPLDPELPIVSSGLIRTDGTWAWPDAFAYFLRRYAVAVPEDFIEHARAAGFHVSAAEGPQRYTLPGLAFEDEEIE